MAKATKRTTERTEAETCNASVVALLTDAVALLRKHSDDMGIHWRDRIDIREFVERFDAHNASRSEA